MKALSGLLLILQAVQHGSYGVDYFYPHFLL